MGGSRRREQPARTRVSVAGLTSKNWRGATQFIAGCAATPRLPLTLTSRTAPKRAAYWYGAHCVLLQRSTSPSGPELIACWSAQIAYCYPTHRLLRCADRGLLPSTSRTAPRRSRPDTEHLACSELLATVARRCSWRGLRHTAQTGAAGATRDYRATTVARSASFGSGGVLL
jgi:hypothetical protein